MVTGRMPARFHQHSLRARPEGHLLGSHNRTGSILQTGNAEKGSHADPEDSVPRWWGEMSLISRQGVQNLTCSSQC